MKGAQVHLSAVDQARLAAIVLLAAGAWAAGGCSSGGGVASLNGGPADGRTQPEIARAMVECLQNAGVPALELPLDGIVDGMDGKVIVDFPDDELQYLSDGIVLMEDSYREGISEAELEAEWEEVRSLAAKYLDSGGNVSGKPFLIIGTDDHTKSWVKCLRETGYADPTNAAAEEFDARFAQRTLEATLEWLKCARANGYSDLKDPDPPRSEDPAAQAMALLPGEITESELRKLLEACPNFDSEAHEAADQMEWDGTLSGSEAIWGAYPSSVDPVIGFDVPGFNGDDRDGAMDGLSEAEQVRLSSLREIIEAPVRRYVTERAD
jgi:hypothetical protein